MRIRTLAVAIIGVGCIAAAAAAGYLALRQNQADTRLDGQATAKPDQPHAPAAQDAGTPAQTPPAPPAAEEMSAAKPASNQAKADVHSKATAAIVASPKPAPPLEPVPATSPDTTLTKPVAAEVQPPVAAAAPIMAAADAPPPVAPPVPQYLELTIPVQSVIGIRLDASISTETAKLEDRVTARVTRDVTVSGHTVIPAGARMEGTITAVDRGGKFKDHARLGVKFNTLYLADNTRVPIQTETIFREDDSASSAAASKIGGGAVVGAILGAMLGGKKGAAIGSVAGGGAGTAAVATGRGNEATFSAGMTLTVQLSAPLTVTIQKF